MALQEFVHCASSVWPILNQSFLITMLSTPSLSENNVALRNALWSIATKYVGNEPVSQYYFSQALREIRRLTLDTYTTGYFLLTYLYLVSSYYIDDTLLMPNKAIIAAIDDNMGSLQALVVQR